MEFKKLLNKQNNFILFYQKLVPFILIHKLIFKST